MFFHSVSVRLFVDIGETLLLSLVQLHLPVT